MGIGHVCDHVGGKAHVGRALMLEYEEININYNFVVLGM